MPSFEIFEKIIVFLTNTIGIWLGFWVWNSNKKEKLNQWFGVMTFFVLLWVDFAYLGYRSKNALQALFYYRLNFGMVSLFLFSSYYFFIICFLRERRKTIERLVFWGSFLFFFLSLFTNLIIKNVVIREWAAEIIYGELGNVFSFFALFVALIILYFLFKSYFVFPKTEKLKVQYFFLGIILYIALNSIFNVFIPSLLKTVQYSKFGDYSAIFLLSFTAYAIVKRELFGIRVVLTSIFVGLIAVLLFLDAVFFTQVFTIQVLKGIAFGIFLIFGYLLIKSVIREIKRREELERLTKQLEKANIELEKLSTAKSEFISIASHQLRTPLSIVKGYISMILEGNYGNLSEKAKKPMENVYQSNERLIKLVENILSVSRIESGKMGMNLEKASIEDIISSVVNEFKIETKSKNLYLKFEKQKKPLPKVLIDREKIRQVILNIVDNAIRYTKKGGIEIKLKVSAKAGPASGGKIQIQVKDTGEGMTKEELEKIFSSFSRGMAGNRFWTSGAGLGLYIAKKFVEMHDGKIWAESQGKSKGSQFYIELPMR